MCKCTPGIRTPYCGKVGCERPARRTIAVKKEEFKNKALQYINNGDDILDFPDGQLILSWQHKPKYVYVIVSEDNRLEKKYVHALSVEMGNYEMVKEEAASVYDEEWKAYTARNNMGLSDTEFYIQGK